MFGNIRVCMYANACLMSSRDLRNGSNYYNDVHKYVSKNLVNFLDSLPYNFFRYFDIYEIFSETTL